MQHLNLSSQEDLNLLAVPKKNSPLTNKKRKLNKNEAEGGYASSSDDHKVIMLKMEGSLNAN
jgi:hypothetical protein